MIEPGEAKDLVTVCCDLCGVETKSVLVPTGVIRPAGWYRRQWQPGILNPEQKPDRHACSRTCLDLLEATDAHGET